MVLRRRPKGIKAGSDMRLQTVPLIVQAVPVRMGSLEATRAAARLWTWAMALSVERRVVLPPAPGRATCCHEETKSKGQWTPQTMCLVCWRGCKSQKPAGVQTW